MWTKELDNCMNQAATNGYCPMSVRNSRHEDSTRGNRILRRLRVAPDEVCLTSSDIGISYCIKPVERQAGGTAVDVEEKIIKWDPSTRQGRVEA